MPVYYSDARIAELGSEYAKARGKFNALTTSFIRRPYRTERGKEFATHGFLRRLKTMWHCIETVFDRLPPEMPDIPNKKSLEDAIVALQAFIFNVFGCTDNLAWLWVEEKGVKRPDGRALPANSVGLGTKYQTVMASFSQAFRDYLVTREDWFAHLENYRHALAHRIPLYIPPYCIHPANEATYKQLDQQIFQARLNGDEETATQLKAQQRPLQSFHPLMKHSFAENNAAVVIHPQMLVDFITIDELASRMLDELGMLPAP